MPKTVCPLCGKGFHVEEEDAVLYEQVTCPNCDAPLEVIDEDPLTVEELID